MIARLDVFLFSLAVDWLSGRLGYDWRTWPFWLVAFPLCLFYGFMRGLRS